MKLAHLTRVAGTAAVVSVALAACSSGGGAPQQGGETGGTARGGTLTLGAIGEQTSWDPAQAHVGHSLQLYQPVYDTLILREPDGTLSPMLATEWAYNDDRTQLTIDLRDDVTFSDGAAFDADAVKANIDHFKTANGRQAAQLAAVESAEVVDEDTVQLNLTAPDPALEFYLSQAAGLMGSPEALGTEELASVPVGSGPYVWDASASVAGSQYTFTAREDYWNPDLQKFDKIVFKVLTDVTARLNAIVSGQVDSTVLDARTADQAEQANLAILEDYQVDWQGLLLFDREGKLDPALGDVRVRQAINYAIDRETLLDQLLSGRGEVTHQVFGPDSGAYVEELDELYSYDPDKARELLADAGYEDGFDLKIPVLAGFDPIVAALGQQLGEVGIRVTSETVAAQTFIPDIAQGKHPVFLFNLFQGEPWVAINQLISTQALWNPFDTTSPELQAMIDEVQTAGENAGEEAKDVNRYITENAWFAPFFRIDQVIALNDKVTAEPQIQQAVPSIYNYAPAQ